MIYSTYELEYWKCRDDDDDDELDDDDDDV